MASRRFFGYEANDDYYTAAAPYNYFSIPVDDLYDYYYATPAPYNYQRQPAPTRSRSSRGIFAGADPAAAKPTRRERETKTSFSIPVHGPDSDPEPEPERERKTAPAEARAEPVAPAMSAEEAAVKMQATARGLLARKSVRAVREVEREAEQVLAKTASEAGALLADPRARAAVGEALMRMLLRLDAVRGARQYRRRITKRVLALQDAVDALETRPAPAPVLEEADADTPEATAVEMAEESIVTKVHTPTQMKFDGAVAAAAEPEAEAGEEKEAVPRDANADVDEPEDSDAEGEWEMVTEENEHAEPVAATSDGQEPPREEPACPFETTITASAGAASDGVNVTKVMQMVAASDGVDVTKVMQMVAALCEQSAKQCAVISALAERVDALERTVLRMEDAGSRRRRAKKLSTEGK